MNIARTGILLAGMTALFLGIGYLLGGPGGMIIALMVAVGMNAFAYWNSDKMVLRMYGAREADQRTAPELVEIVARLAQRAGMPMPRVYVIDTPQPNAFATGRNPENAAVAATTGLMRILSAEELAGVMAHELAHVRNRDTLIMTITATLAGAISMLANVAMFFGPMGRSDENNGNPLGVVGILVLSVLAPMAAMVVQMSISRAREYEADRMGAAIAGNPLWLAGALEKLQMGARQIANNTADRNPATAHMFIINPLNARSLGQLFSTHPSTEDRVARLRQMARDYTIQPSSGGLAPGRTAGPAASSGPWGNGGRGPGNTGGPWGQAR